MTKSAVLVIDAIINLILGLILMIFSKQLVNLIGIPKTDQLFYPNILGAILFGIGVALLIECFRKPQQGAGLGLNGAIVINLSGGTMLAGWLIFGNLTLPVHGLILLWFLVIMLIIVSIIEIAVSKKT